MNPDDPQSDYDMRGFFQGLQTGDPDATTGLDPNDVDPATGQPKMHFTDKWKTPYHDSFSADSKYALPNAPVWKRDETLVDPRTGQIIYDEAPNQGDFPVRNLG